MWLHQTYSLTTKDKAQSTRLLAPRWRWRRWRRFVVLIVLLHWYYRLCWDLLLRMMWLSPSGEVTRPIVFLSSPSTSRRLVVTPTSSVISDPCLKYYNWTICHQYFNERSDTPYLCLWPVRSSGSFFTRPVTRTLSRTLSVVAVIMWLVMMG